MNTVVMKWICMTAIATAITTATTYGQDVALETKVISLRNVDSVTAVAAVSDLSIDGLYSVTSAARVNKLIVQGEPTAINAIVEVIEQLDLRPEARHVEVDITTDFVPVGSYPLKELHLLVHSSLDLDGPTKVAADAINGRIVVSGTRKDIQAVRSLVAQVDRPRKSYSIEMFFIRSLGDNEDGVKITPLPKAMAPIAKSLDQSGFGTLTLMAPIIVRVDDGGMFQQEARHTIRHPADTNESLEFSVSGEVNSVPDSDVLAIGLQARMIGISKENSRSDAFFELSTSISIQERRYAVLAAAPASTRNGDAVALVVRVNSGSFE